MSSAVRSIIRKILPQSAVDQLRSVQRKKEAAAQSQELARIDIVYDALDSLDKEPWADYFHKHAPERAETAPDPKGVGDIEINDSCNIDCLMCSTSLATRPKGLMKMEKFERIVAELAGMGVKAVSLHTIGDPLANKRLPQYLQILREHGVHVGTLSSNCLMLDRHMDTIFEYRDIIDRISASIDGSSKWVYEKIRKGGNFEELHANLLAFTKRNNAHPNPFPVWVNCVVTNDNYHELAYLPSVFDYVTEPSRFNFGMIDGLTPDHSYFEEAKVFEDYYAHIPCGALWAEPHIHKDGNLTLCTRDYNGDLVFGHIDQGTIVEQYNGEAIKAMRRTHLKGDTQALPKLCQSCVMIDPRLNTVIDGVIHYFYEHIKKSPAILQDCLNSLAPMLREHRYADAAKLIRELA